MTPNPTQKKVCISITRFNVPQGTAHVTGTGDDLVVVEETTARQVARVAGQFPADADVALARLEAVYRTDVVETAARHVAARRGVRAGHHP